MGHFDSQSQFSIRPLVRYVDEDRAVIEIRLTVRPSSTEAWEELSSQAMEAHIEILGAQGFSDEQCQPVDWSGQEGWVRCEVVRPDRWWPAGLGDQSLYDLTVRLLSNNDLLTEHQTTIGLTSVRRIHLDERLQALVNGQVLSIQAVVPIDLADEHSLLPAAGDSLLLVRGHYGPDVLYDAADRAGILLIQCVPIHPQAQPDTDMAQQIDRLCAHPSLVGWFVGHLGELTDPIGQTIRRLDPTRTVFMQAPALGLS